MRDQIIRVKGTDQVPILLVGNKCDLAHQRQVRSEDGAALAEYWACPFAECSAKSAHNVNTVFAEIVREINYVQSARQKQRHSFFWAAECSADLILGINRCLEVPFPKIARKLFHNKRVYIWIVFCNLYGLYWLLFSHNYIFNGRKFEISFDPLNGYRPFRMELFANDLLPFTVHNTILALGSPIIYSIFSICVFFKGRELISSVSKEEKLSNNEF
uniref:Uncharacterized protein n=1 Tax=Meloidogyne floridensis TaxID=298350 RepID=A0A915NJG2_9BILA